MEETNEHIFVCRIGCKHYCTNPISPVQAATHTSDILISEYIEGSSFNKAIELYNGTGADIDLANYSLELYSNGASVSLTNFETIRNYEKW